MLRRRESTSLDYRHPFRPASVALANRVTGGLQRLGLLRASFDEEALLATARRRTGLHDFGETPLQEPLRALLRALDAEARLHPLGRVMVGENLVRMLANRLRIEHLLRLHPEIRDEQLQPPVVIIGLQRTGTTLLHRMLATDRRLRYLASWEAINPAPRDLQPRAGRNGSASRPTRRGAAADPRARFGDGSDGRIRAALQAQWGLTYLAPDFFAIHPVEALAPEEDCLLFDYTFWSTVPEATLRIPSFTQWLEQQDLTPAYRYVGDILRLLLWQRRDGGRWLLKTPFHMEHLGCLRALYPGVRVIQTHRDPARALSSFCSMLAHGRGVFSDAVDPIEIGQQWRDKTARMIELTLQERAAAPPEQFLDVSYYELVRDPMATIGQIYGWLGLPLTPGVAAGMREWIAHNPQHKHGRHRYRLADFGLERQDIDRRFARYRARHGIPTEPTE